MKILTADQQDLIAIKENLLNAIIDEVMTTDYDETFKAQLLVAIVSRVLIWEPCDEEA